MQVVIENNSHHVGDSHNILEILSLVTKKVIHSPHKSHFVLLQDIALPTSINSACERMEFANICSELEKGKAVLIGTFHHDKNNNPSNEISQESVLYLKSPYKYYYKENEQYQEINVSMNSTMLSSMLIFLASQNKLGFLESLRFASAELNKAYAGQLDNYVFKQYMKNIETLRILYTKEEIYENVNNGTSQINLGLLFRDRMDKQVSNYKLLLNAIEQMGKDAVQIDYIGHNDLDGKFSQLMIESAIERSSHGENIYQCIQNVFMQDKEIIMAADMMDRRAFNDSEGYKHFGDLFLPYLDYQLSVYKMNSRIESTDVLMKFVKESIYNRMRDVIAINGGLGQLKCKDDVAQMPGFEEICADTANHSECLYADELKEVILETALLLESKSDDGKLDQISVVINPPNFLRYDSTAGEGARTDLPGVIGVPANQREMCEQRATLLITDTGAALDVNEISTIKPRLRTQDDPTSAIVEIEKIFKGIQRNVKAGTPVAPYDTGHAYSDHIRILELAKLKRHINNCNAGEGREQQILTASKKIYEKLMLEYMNSRIIYVQRNLIERYGKTDITYIISPVNARELSNRLEIEEVMLGKSKAAWISHTSAKQYQTQRRNIKLLKGALGVVVRVVNEVVQDGRRHAVCRRELCCGLMKDSSAGYVGITLAENAGKEVKAKILA